jgi:hypothetical protein
VRFQSKHRLGVNDDPFFTLGLFVSSSVHSHSYQPTKRLQWSTEEVRVVWKEGDGDDGSVVDGRSNTKT